VLAAAKMLEIVVIGASQRAISRVKGCSSRNIPESSSTNNFTALYKESKKESFGDNRLAPEHPRYKANKPKETIANLTGAEPMKGKYAIRCLYAAF